MDPAIAWVVQTILSTLLVDKLDAWIRQVGLVDDVEQLKTEIKRIKIVFSALKEKGVGNERLVEPLALLVDQLNDAHNVVVELDYYMLEDQVQGVIIGDYEGLHGTQDEIWSGDTDTPMNRSVGKLRSAVWKHFTITENDDDGNPVKSVCRHCGKELTSRTKNGTSSMAKHLKNEHSLTFTKKPSGVQASNPSSAGEPIATGSSSRNGKEKKRRSTAWDYVDVIEEEENGKPIKARCKYCPTEIKCGGTTGTAGILNHNKRCKKKPVPDDQPSNPSSAGEPIATGSSSRNSKEKKRPSTAWGYVDVIEKEENGKPIKARCKYCPTEIKCGGTTGTAGILNHEKRCKKKPGPNDWPPNTSSTGDASANVTRIVISDPSNRKRRRSDEESAQIAAAMPTVLGDSSSSKRRRAAEESAQITAAMPTVVGDSSSRKRRRADEESSQITTATPTVVCDSLSRKRGRADGESAQITAAVPTVVGDSSSRKRRADEESVQMTAAVPTVVGDSSSRKRGRVGEESVQVTSTNIHTPWDKVAVSDRIQKITSQIQYIRHTQQWLSEQVELEKRGEERELFRQWRSEQVEWEEWLSERVEFGEIEEETEERLLWLICQL